MKNKVIQFIKDFILMAIVISIVEFISYELKIISSFGIPYIIGFMIGWSIIQIVKLSFESKKNRK